MDGESMVGFGHKQAWLAVRDGDPAAVRAVLDLRDLGPVSWRAGVDLAYLTDDRVVLTPLLTGAGGDRWLLVTGWWLWHAADRFPVARLSAELDTEVHRYATHRGIEKHEWERAVDGRLVRAFGYSGESGELVRSIGDPDAAELALGLPAQSEADDDVDILIGEADVGRLAARWSVDPTTLDGRPAPGPLRAAAPQ
jgi:hypothetical protein